MLLRSDPGQAHRGMVAKVADFGLSVAVDQAQTHVSAMRQVGVGLGGAQTHVSTMRQVCGRVCVCVWGGVLKTRLRPISAPGECEEGGYNMYGSAQ